MNRVKSTARTYRPHRKQTQAPERKPAGAVFTKQSASSTSKAPPTSKAQTAAKGDVPLMPLDKQRLTQAGAQRSAANEKAEQTNQQLPNSLPKRRHDTLPSENDEPQLKRARLTRTNLAVFDKMVQKGINHSAGLSAGSALGKSTIVSSTRTSTTTSGFALQADKNGILDPSTSKPPVNLHNIHERYDRSRRTASPTESAYEDYTAKVERAVNESTMVVEVSGKLLKEYPEKCYTRAFNQAFTDFPKDVGFNNSLSTPQPDFVEGLEAREFRPMPVDEHISSAVLYKDNPHSITLPHLAGEWKGRDQSMEKARLQSAFNGAALVYSRNQALSYIGKSDPPGHAEITTFTTNGTTLNLYAHYAAPSKSGILEYHQYRIKSTSLIDTYQGHKAGRRGLRNEQDHAREQSYALRDEVTEHWMRQHHMALHTIAEEATPVPGVGPATDEDETGNEAIIVPGVGSPLRYEDETGNEIRRPCEPTPPMSTKAHSKSTGSRSSLSTPVSEVGRSMQPPLRRSLRQKEKAKKVKYC